MESDQLGVHRCLTWTPCNSRVHRGDSCAACVRRDRRLGGRHCARAASTQTWCSINFYFHENNSLTANYFRVPSTSCSVERRLIQRVVVPRSATVCGEATLQINLGHELAWAGRYLGWMPLAAGAPAAEVRASREKSSLFNGCDAGLSGTPRWGNQGYTYG